MSSTQDKKPFIVTVGGTPVDFDRLPPLTVGDKKKLKNDEQYKIDVSAGIRVVSPEDEAKLVLFIVRKLRPETTLEEVDALTIGASQRILSRAVEASLEIDVPFSTPSTSSPAGTAGGQTKS